MKKLFVFFLEYLDLIEKFMILLLSLSVYLFPADHFLALHEPQLLIFLELSALITLNL